MAMQMKVLGFRRVVVTFAVVLLAGTALLAQQDLPSRVNRVLVTRSCVGCDLNRASFNSKNLKGVDLSGAKLVGAQFYKADLGGANLDGADLTGANLTFADLNNTNIGSADLTGANLKGATGAALQSAITTATTICPDGQAGPCR